MISRLGISLMLAVCMLLIPSRLTAQDTQVQGQRVKLNNHAFINLSPIQTPFTNTNMTMTTGFGETGDFDFPPQLIRNDTITGLQGDLRLLDLGFQYRQKVRDWIAFYLHFGTAFRVGDETSALLSQGSNTVFHLEIGTMIKIIRKDHLMLSLSYEVQNFEGNFVDIDGFIEDILNGVKPRLVRKVPALTTGVGAHFAWGISPTFGFRTNVAYSYGETFTRGSSSSRYNVSFSVDADFNPKFKVPLGLAFGYTVTTEPEIVYVDDRQANWYLIKIAYTGRAEFDFGIELSKISLPLENVDSRPEVNAIQLVMSYNFN